MVSERKLKNIQKGIIIETFPNATFRVKTENGEEVFAHLAGKMRLNFIKVLIGDKVELEISPYDSLKGRIIKRL